MKTDIKPIERIIWSADVEDEEALTDNLDRMRELQMIKIDRLFVEDADLTVIDRLNERGMRVFDDAKIVEIPSKMEAIAKKHLKHRPWMLNCMAGGFSSGVWKAPTLDEIDGLKRFADVCHQAGTKPCGVTVLTSKTTKAVKREYNDRLPIDQVLFYVGILLEAGFTDIVCSPNELSAIRSEGDFNVLDINTPSIRPAGSKQDDQARADTPEAAVAAGATRLVIGRPIHNGDPAENLRNIVASLTS